jgi:hypothetical protein
MTIKDISEEYDSNGRLSRRAVGELRQMLLSNDPYEAISLTADLGCIELSAEIGNNLTSTDSMVRWIAAATLFTRFRKIDYIAQCFEMAKDESDEMVRSIALVGLGELLVFENRPLQKRQYARLLLDTLLDENQYPPFRSAAYEGILAAMDVSPADRFPATKLPDFSKDISLTILEAFKNRYCS